MRRRVMAMGVVAAFTAASGWWAAPAEAADRSKVVNVYAWSDYYPASVIAKFQTETGMHVNSTVLDSPDAAETALSVGSSNYDIVTMNAAPQLAREIPKGFWRPLDKAKMPNLRNADAGILTVLTTVDPGNRIAVPWMWGTTGVMFDADKLKSLIGEVPADPLDLILKKDVAAKFAKCGINILDSWGDMLPAVAHYLGQATLSAEPGPLAAVMAKLEEIKPYIRRIASGGYYAQLADGDMCLAFGYSGDLMIARRVARETNTQIRLDYAYLKQAVPLFVDNMVIPADSPNPAGAALFIDFMMRPEVSAEVTRFIGFASGNAAALPLLDAAIRDNVIVYPPPAVRARFALERVYTPEELRTFLRAWQRFKTGQ